MNDKDIFKKHGMDGVEYLDDFPPSDVKEMLKEARQDERDKADNARWFIASETNQNMIKNLESDISAIKSRWEALDKWLRITIIHDNWDVILKMQELESGCSKEVKK